MINIKAIRNIWLILSIPTIIKRDSHWILILKIASVSYKNLLINRLFIYIYSFNIKKISLITRFI
jgi:hypothetical protein